MINSRTDSLKTIMLETLKVSLLYPFNNPLARDLEAEFTQKYTALLLEEAAKRRIRKHQSERTWSDDSIGRKKYYREPLSRSPSPRRTSAATIPKPYMHPTRATERKRRNSFSTELRKTSRQTSRVKPNTPWYPRTTIPEPFQMTLRQASIHRTVNVF